jgi:hypothetical protein
MQSARMALRIPLALLKGEKPRRLSMKARASGLG